MSVQYEEYSHLAKLLAHVILHTGPVKISYADFEEGLPDEARSVVVEATDEGYLVFISDKKTEDFNDETE